MGNVDTKRTFDDIERGIAVGTSGLTFLERLIALFRPDPAARAERMRKRATNKRKRAAATTSETKRKRLTRRADVLEDEAYKLSPPPPPPLPVEESGIDDTQDAGV